ncbi:hypothetical protein C8Q79DRAFT_119681 [Trametes meyenii]|nr:hypothetical protein C8Q79DRAFT_119681 [Trametes meyenii]
METLAAEQLNSPNRINVNLQGKHMHRVLKLGATTQVIVVTLTRFKSFMRRYSAVGNMESLELLRTRKRLTPFPKEATQGL